MHERVSASLQVAGIPYRVIKHAELSIPVTSPYDVADALDIDVRRITKTILLHIEERSAYCLAILPIPDRVSLDRVASHVNVQRVRLASREAPMEILGYPSHGVSPFGAKGISVLMDEQVMEWPTILVGAGVVGEEIEVTPDDLRDAVCAIMTSVVE
jgi:Cys-tRNA(Pro)/Cys-tRNA(Cys) deacylase